MLTVESYLQLKLLLDLTGDFGTIGSMLIGEIKQKTNIRFKMLKILKIKLTLSMLF